MALVADHQLPVDYTRPVRKEPDRCHTRWHPDIPPALRCAPGDDVVLQTRDAVDGQYTMDSTPADTARIDRGIVHPLTGPIHIEGAAPGDVLVVEILDITPGTFGYTALVPGLGFLRDEPFDPFIVRWEIDGPWATSPDIPGVRIPGAPFMGVLGLAPSRVLLAAITAREQALLADGALLFPPNPDGAVPDTEPIASKGLRTMPPREIGGNLDTKQMVAGTRVLLPVSAPGALFSAGDAHFAQGDGEVCGTAIETRARLHVRFQLRPGEATTRDLRDVRFERPGPALPPLASSPFFATTGLCVDGRGAHAENLSVAARSAVRNMVDHLCTEYGYTREQAYALCSVAVDLKVSEVVDVPNFVVSAVLPLEIFT
jgi:formamidase